MVLWIIFDKHGILDFNKVYRDALPYSPDKISTRLRNIVMKIKTIIDELVWSQINYHISSEQLEQMENADNIFFSSNHISTEDNPIIMRFLLDHLWFQENHYFIMKWTLSPILKKFWWIPVFRSKDLRMKNGIWDGFLVPSNLPQIIEWIFQKPGSNVVLYPQWTRKKYWKNEFDFRSPAISCINNIRERNLWSLFVAIKIVYNDKPSVNPLNRTLADIYFHVFSEDSWNNSELFKKEWDEFYS